jgi:8-oxo-dGTP pyrophosphatase MutT (NUDIX family)
MKSHRYAAAGGVVVNSDRVLILHRPQANDFRLPKGEIERGESARAAALREVAEETGYADLEIVQDLGKQTVSFEYQNEYVHRDECYFLMHLRSLKQIERSAKDLHLIPVWTSWDEALNTLSFKEERRWIVLARKDQITEYYENSSL